MKWYVAALLILLAALALQSGLLAYAMYVLLGALLVSRLLARASLDKVAAVRTCEQTTAEIGDRVAVEVTVENRGRLMLPWVLLEDLLPGAALGGRSPRLGVKGKRLLMRVLGAGKQAVVRYKIECKLRGYYQVGPLLLESGDLFGLHRRYRVVTQPHFLLVYPKVVPLQGYDLASRRPIGDVRLTHRLYEDPTRIGGVRQYQAGDPLNRIHWRATARAGTLHSKVYEPSTLAGSTILLDLHRAGYPKRGEPQRSELAVTAAASLANAVYELGQQVGLVSNGRDAADRIRQEGWENQDFRTRRAARRRAAMQEESERLEPVIVETRRGAEQFQRIREALARLELTDGMTCAQLILETAGRLPRDATVVAVLPEASVETALALGSLRRHGLAVTAVLIACDVGELERSYGRLVAEGVRDVRHLRDEAGLPELCRQQAAGAGGWVVLQGNDAGGWAADRSTYNMDSELT
ncbi:MAG TPA: DUF58 domain-containing protein [Gemmataceae bacterium]|nr:DUF58 domain-containing protein [Gemmataceae bacterium]